jgi:hypothetical protein
MSDKHERAERLAADRGRRAALREPRFGKLDEDGRPEGDDHALWHIAAYLPEGREAEVAEFLAAHGIGVYRMWKVMP